MKHWFTLALALWLPAFSVLAETAEPADAAAAETSMDVPTVAILPFEVRNDLTGRDSGKSLAELLSVSLLERGNVELVERAELEKALDELQLSASGLVDRDSRNQLGRLIGARILITGSIFRTGNKNYLVGKVIGTETSRVLGASVSGGEDFASMIPALTEKLSGILEKNAAKLLPRRPTQAAVAAALAETVRGNQRKVLVEVKEDIHASVPDPAAETELKKLLMALGFQIVSAGDEADFRVTGEALAAHGGNYRQFISADARLELSVFGPDRKLLKTGSMRETVAGSTYVIAAKEAIAQAALRLAAELFPVMK